MDRVYKNVHIWHGVCCVSAASFTHNKRDMPMHTPSRRSVLTSGAALAAIIAAPARLRAAPREIVIGGPAGAAKYFNADLFPVLEKKLDCKVLYEGTNSLTNLQKMQADKAAPRIPAVMLADPVMLPAAGAGRIAPVCASAIPNLGRLV